MRRRGLFRGGSGESGLVPLNGLVSYHKFDNNSHDSITGSQLEGINTTYSPGKIGQCANFNGSGYVRVNPDILSPTEFSVGFWAKTNDTASEYRAFDFNANTGSAYTSIRLNAGGVANRIGILVFDGVDGTPKTVDGFNLTEWNLIGCTAKNNDRYDLWVNGNLVLSDTSLGAFTEVADRWNTIGAARLRTTHFLKGQMDEVFIYNRILTVEEWSGLYNNGNGITL